MLPHTYCRGWCTEIKEKFVNQVGEGIVPTASIILDSTFDIKCCGNDNKSGTQSL